MTRSSVAANRNQKEDGSLQEIGVSGVDGREVVHLLAVPPPIGGGTCTCTVCGLVFQSRQATWIDNRKQHQDNNYHGNYRSCRPHT